MRGKIYSLDELNRALPLIRAIVRDIKREYSLLREELVALGIPTDDHSLEPEEALRDLPWDLRDRIDEIRDWVRELADLGVLVRDPRNGLAEAYGEQNGEIVFFSWRLGEEEVRFWHELTSSSGDRRPVHVLAG